MQYLTDPLFLIALTFGIYILMQMLQRRLRLRILNPILLSIILIILILLGLDIDYDTYSAGGRYIEFWLKPAVVALGVPLYRQLESIRRQMIPLLVAELAGCVAGVVSVVLIAALLGASDVVIMSLAPKAVTTPIAMEISAATGGIPALTAAVVVCTGIFGSMAGYNIVRLSRIRSNPSSGLSIGTAAHAVGTSAAMEHSPRHGAYASLGLTLNGLLTSLLAPTILDLLGYTL